LMLRRWRWAGATATGEIADEMPLVALMVDSANPFSEFQHKVF